MSRKIYTIGYAGSTVAGLVATLKKYGISAVIDVRSSPYSKAYPDFNKDALADALKAQGLYYRNYSAQFGARQTDRRCYSPLGHLDFEIFARSAAFQDGVKKLCDSMDQGYTFALMCAEKDPLNCHRSILVSRAFYQLGYEVVHILPGGRTQTQEDIQARLLNKYFPARDQESLFDTPRNQEELLQEAYRRQNAEIGHRLEE